jgi:L-lysine exporter family protein LysE/ArgO
MLRNILLGISLAAPIGPAGVAVIQAGLAGGFKRAFLTGLGVTLGDMTYLVIVFLGIWRFLTVPAVKVGIYVIGALALLYFALRSLLAAHASLEAKPIAGVSPRGPLVLGYIVNVSNPIAVVWWLGVFGSILAETAAGSSRWSALAGGSAILLGILAWHSSMSLLSHWGRQILTVRVRRAISVIASLALLGFAARFVFLAWQAAGI